MVIGVAKGKFYSHVEPRLPEVEQWARDGVPDEQIAGNLGIAYSTFRIYCAKYNALAKALSRGKTDSNEVVEGSLFKRCQGYNAPVRKIFKVRRIEYDPDTGRKMREYDELAEGVEEVHVPADVTAMMFWLANRSRDRWQYRPEPKDEDLTNDTGVIEIPAVMTQGEDRA